MRAAVELTREAPGAPVKVRPLNGPPTTVTPDGGTAGSEATDTADLDEAPVTTSSTDAGFPGADVLLLEKAAFPRDKICGDGLTPRAVKQLIGMGFDLDQPGWQKNRGLRIVGAGHRLELPWPELGSFPDFGMVRTRADLDEILARHAEKAGARLKERTAVTGPVFDERTGRVVGVTAKPVDDRGRRAGQPSRQRAVDASHTRIARCLPRRAHSEGLTGEPARIGPRVISGGVCKDVRELRQDKADERHDDQERYAGEHDRVSEQRTERPEVGRSIEEIGVFRGPVVRAGEPGLQ